MKTKKQILEEAGYTPKRGRPPLDDSGTFKVQFVLPVKYKKILGEKFNLQAQKKLIEKLDQDERS